MKSKHILILMLISLVLLFGFYGCKSKSGGMTAYQDERSYAKKDTRAMVPADADEEYLEEEQFNTEEYDVINENSFKTVTSNPLSTFSIDVDTASYANMRRFLHQNNKPPKDAVRIEELINYFSYSYPEPDGDDPFSVNLDLAPCFWNEEHQLIRIGLKGKSIDTEDIPPANLVFLLDVSGSMHDSNKLPLLKKAFGVLVERLREEDRVAIVVYAGASGVVLRPTAGNKKAKIMSAINKLRSGGSTAGSSGIKLAYKLARENFIEGGNNRIILATDGDFNVGPSSDGELVRLIEKEREKGVFLTILGFGMGNYKDSKMEKLSNAGNGNYAYIDTILEAKKVLGAGIWGTLYTIAKDVKIQVEFNPAKVKAYRLIGYENRLLNKEDFENDKKDAGEIGADHRVTAFYEIVPAGSKEEIKDSGDLKYQTSEIVNSDDVMTVKLRYKQPDEDVSKLIEQSVTEADLQEDGLSQDFMFASAVAEFGLLLRDSEFKGDATYEQVLELAKESRGEDPHGYRAEFIKLVKIAESL